MSESATGPVPAARFLLGAGGGATFFALASLVPLAAANGGYFPTSWGWSALAFCWAAALALLLGTPEHPGRFELAFIVGIALVTLWTFASVAWTANVTQSVLEGERTLAYLGGVTVGLLIVRRLSYVALLVGVWGAISVVCTYALLTRLLPERLGSFDPVAGYRLAAPLGYWNALGVFAAMAALLALGLAANTESRALAALTAASLPILVSTLYFTFSRGAALSLGLGLVATVALESRRLRFVTAALVLIPWSALAVWLGTRSPGLTRSSTSLRAATLEGHRLAFAIALLSLASAATVLVLGRLRARLRIRAAVRVTYAAALIVVLGGLLIGTFVRFGSPPALAKRAYDAFNAPPKHESTDLNRHFLSLSGTRRPIQYRMAWRDFRAHPVLGSGAGSYERYWLQHRRQPDKVRDVHSLYFETLAELGLIGLLLVVATLTVPLGAAVVAHRRAGVPTAAGAYAAFLFHAGGDWDWEMSAVTLAALFCGVAVVAAARPEHEPRPPAKKLRVLGVGAAVAVGVLAFAGFAGNLELSASAKAARAGRWSSAAAQARRAATWAPWSAQPWQLLGEAQLGLGDPASALASFQTAISKDGKDWTIWFDLARATSGATQQRALAEAARLNPLSPEIAELRTELAADGAAQTP